MRRGPLYMILASLMFTIMIGAVKVAREEMGPFELILWRGLISVPLLLAFCRGRALAIVDRRTLVLRSLLGFGAMACFFTAAKGLDLTDISLIGKLQPLLVAVLAPLALGASERVRPLVWLVLALGLGGSALIVGPSLEGGATYGLWALAAAILSAAAHVAVRALGRSESPYALVVWFQMATFVLAAGAVLLTDQELPAPPSADLWPYLAACGVAAAVGQLLMTHAYAVDRAAAIAAASYVSPLFGLAGDVMLFQSVPEPVVFAGGGLVITAGLLLLRLRATGPGLEVTTEDRGAPGR